jgi:DNA phosphorothioation-dependent restriction protein DptH
MPRKINSVQRAEVLRLLAQGQDRIAIAALLGISPGQVSAVQAHVKMGRYSLPDITEPALHLAGRDRQAANKAGGVPNHLGAVLLGTDVETSGNVYWSPDPRSGLANPHVMVIGESGFGKTYTVACILAELARKGIHSVVFDYGQGFSLSTVPETFVHVSNPLEIHASRDGVEINPLQVFASDVHGPVNVAQRVADTFSRVYPKIGVQQHAVIRQAALDVMGDYGILPETEETWAAELPSFDAIEEKLEQYAKGYGKVQPRIASLVASHISTLFVFRTFRKGGRKLAWTKMLASKNMVFIIQLKGLEHSLERAVTEFLLWNLIGYVEALGPGNLRCFIVLDEAHKLSFSPGSPVERLLREGRKYGLGIILASQQADDFSPVAFSNTATKIVFQVGDEGGNISRQLFRKVKNNHSFNQIYQVITKLPRGHAYVVTDNRGGVVSIAPFEERVSRWQNEIRMTGRGQPGAE